MSETTMVITREILAKFGKSNVEAINFPEGKTVKLLGFVNGDEWKSDENPLGYKPCKFGYAGPNQKESIAFAIHIEGEKDPREVPVQMLWNFVVATTEDIFNVGTVAECVKTLGKKIQDLSKNKTVDIKLPNEITVIKKLKAATQWKTISSSIAPNYELLHEDGKSYRETFKDFEFVPAVFKNAAGTGNYQNVVAVQPW